MQTASGLPIRQRVRIRDHEYSGEASYFVTVCTHQKRCIFGRCENERMHLSEIGDLVDREWRRTAELRPDIGFDSYVVMPNHFHALLFVPQSEGADTTGHLARRNDVRRVVALFKAAVTSQVRRMRHDASFEVWQRSFHDHIVRSERELVKIREYILNNPVAWRKDRYYV